MRPTGVISTAFLSLILGVALPAYAQQEQHEQEEQKAKPAQDEKKAQPEKPAKQEEKKTQPPAKAVQSKAKPQQHAASQTHPAAKQATHAQPAKQAQHATAGRIPDDRYKANFGQAHRFRVSQGDYNNHRFQYGGYSFGFVDPWPSNWLYTQDVYVIEINGVYYLCNPSYPGVNVAISVTL
jgi:hypothetical protein